MDCTIITRIAMRSQVILLQFVCKCIFTTSLANISDIIIYSQNCNFQENSGYKWRIYYKFHPFHLTGKMQFPKLYIINKFRAAVLFVFVNPINFPIDWETKTPSCLCHWFFCGINLLAISNKDSILPLALIFLLHQSFGNIKQRLLISKSIRGFFIMTPN